VGLVAAYEKRVEIVDEVPGVLGPLLKEDETALDERDLDVGGTLAQRTCTLRRLSCPEQWAPRLAASTPRALSFRRAGQSPRIDGDR
jgi:hypothetical protein